MLSSGRCLGAWTTIAPCSCSGSDSGTETGRPVSEPERRRCCLARRGRVRAPEPRRCLRGERPGAGAVRRDDLGGLGAPKHEPHPRAWSDEALGGLDRLLVDAAVADCLDEGQARFAQVCLAPRGALLLSSEARHAKDDEEEQDRGRTDDHEVVGVAEFLDEPDRRRDHAGDREQSDARRRQPRPRISRRLLELAHRRVEDGRAPECEVRKPAEVEDDLVVVGVVQERVVVGAVRCEERGGAREQEVERGRLPAGLHGEPDHRAPSAARRRSGRPSRRPSRAASAPTGGRSERSGRRRRGARSPTVRTSESSIPPLSVLFGSRRRTSTIRPANEQRVHAQVDRVTGRREADACRRAGPGYVYV